MMHTIDTKLLAEIVGYLAALIGAVTFLPQAIRVWQTKHTKDISLTSFILLNATTALWLVYGLLLHAAPIIFVNIVILIVGIFIIIMKLRYK